MGIYDVGDDAAVGHLCEEDKVWPYESASSAILIDYA